MAANTLRQRLTTLALAAGFLIALWFAVQGGEYGTLDLVRQQQRRAELKREIDSLNHIVDSLKSYKQKVLTDPKTQERIAREEFGMIRGKELLYRVVPADSGKP